MINGKEYAYYPVNLDDDDEDNKSASMLPLTEGWLLISQDF
jgi:hypothetical protein